MKVVAIIVSYHPDTDRLGRLCDALSTQGASIILVDNSPTADLLVHFAAAKTCRLIGLGDNTGIAHAQNLGIRAALAEGADVVVLFDQDSQLRDGFLARLLTPLNPREPGVAAPVCVDQASHREIPSFRLNRLGWVRKVVSSGRTTPYAIDLVIASGCAVSAATFPVAGMMDEDFFIDFVDFEWCFRCRSKRVPVNVVPGAVMDHSIGEKSGRVLKRGSIHSPTRSYYKVRNCFLLFRKPDVPTLFAVRAIILALLHAMIQLPFVENRTQYLQAFARAIRHGFAGVVGKNPAIS